MRLYHLRIALATTVLTLALAGCQTDGQGRLSFGFQDETATESEAGGEVVCPPNQQCPENSGLTGGQYIGAYVSPEVVSDHGIENGNRSPQPRESFNGPPAGSVTEQIVCPGDGRCPKHPRWRDGWVYSGRLWVTPTDQIFCEPGETCAAYPNARRPSPGYGWFCLRDRARPESCAAAPGRRRR